MSKHRGEPKVQYEITVIESERGWGQDYWGETFNTREEAEARIREVNSRNVSSVAPDYYIKALPEIKEIS